MASQEEVDKEVIYVRRGEARRVLRTDERDLQRGEARRVLRTDERDVQSQCLHVYRTHIHELPNTTFGMQPDKILHG